MNFHDHRVRHIFIIINLGALSIAWTLNISSSHLQQAAPGHEAGGGAAHQPLPRAHAEDLPLQHVARNLHAEGGVLQHGRHEHSVDTGLLKQTLSYTMIKYCADIRAWMTNWSLTSSQGSLLMAVNLSNLTRPVPVMGVVVPQSM